MASYKKDIERMRYCLTALPSDTINELKRKTGEKSILNAINKAVYHYLECNYNP